jgi:hypothetical protein
MTLSSVTIGKGARSGASAQQENNDEDWYRDPQQPGEYVAYRALLLAGLPDVAEGPYQFFHLAPPVTNDGARQARTLRRVFSTRRDSAGDIMNDEAWPPDGPRFDKCGTEAMAAGVPALQIRSVTPAVRRSDPSRDREDSACFDTRFL